MAWPTTQVPDSVACSNELNAQLQALSARVKQLEEGLENSFLGQFWNFCKTVAALAANGVTAPAATAILADPFALKVFQLVAGGSVDTDGIKDLYATLKTVMTVNYKEILLQLAMENLNVQPYGAQIANAVSGEIQAAADQASAELASLIANNAAAEAIQAATEKVNKLNAAAASLNAMITASNDASACKTATSLLGF